MGNGQKNLSHATHGQGLKKAILSYLDLGNDHGTGYTSALGGAVKCVTDALPEKDFSLEEQ